MLAWTCYAIIALVWGSTYYAIALALEAFTPYGMVASRFLFGGVLALLLARFRREALPSRADLPHLMLTGALMLSGSNALVSWSEKHVTSGLAATVCAMVPVFMALFSGERQGLRTWVGLGFGLTGVGILADPFHGQMHYLGVGALLLANILWAFATLHGKHHVKQHESMLGNTALQMLTAGLLGSVLAPFTGGWTSGPVSAKAVLAVGYLSVFGSLVAFSAYIYLARVWPPAKMGTYAYLNPLVAVLLGTWFLNEPFTLRTVFGMLVILAGVAVVQLRPWGAPASHGAEERA
jgi:drug/metabolite transporter (DMT)-like permease